MPIWQLIASLAASLWLAEKCYFLELDFFFFLSMVNPDFIEPTSSVNRKMCILCWCRSNLISHELISSNLYIVGITTTRRLLNGSPYYSPMPFLVQNVGFSYLWAVAVSDSNASSM